MPITAPGDFTMSGKRLICPPGCLEKVDYKVLVIGPEQAKDEKSKKIYSLESSICGAAIHSGMMNDAEGGSVLIHLTKPRGPFITLNQNKIESKEGIQTEIALYLHVAPLPLELKCNQSLLDSDIKLESGKSYFIQCKEGCFSQIAESGANIIFGNNSVGYTIDTPVCKAAIHAGFLGNKHANEFTIIYKKGDPQMHNCYTATTPCKNNGMVSYSKNAKASFIITNGRQACHWFKLTAATNFNAEYFPIIDPEGTVITKGGHISFLQEEKEQGWVHKDFDCANCSIVLEFGLIKNTSTEVVLSSKMEDWFGIIFR